MVEPQVIVEDNNGNFFQQVLQHGNGRNNWYNYFRWCNGDLSGYTLTLTGQEKVHHNFIW